jgi:predicted glycosyltransferase
LRRCRTIAGSLVAKNPDISVLILSVVAVSLKNEFPTRVDFVRVPGVIKLRNGDYSSLSLHMDISEVLALREAIIAKTAEAFDPDVFIVDKEPLGLRGEISETLKALKGRGVKLVLGLRDVMDDPDLLALEWQRKNPVPALENLYDRIWIYGLRDICEPLAGIEIPPSVVDKIAYTGYLAREVPVNRNEDHGDAPARGSYILVTAGGGGDGIELVDWVLRAYEAHGNMPYSAMLLFGPFMPGSARDEFRARADALTNVETRTFDAQAETLMADAAGVIAMGGYNTFCELLSFDKPAILVPRKRPRMEQYIRASRAEELDLVSMLDLDVDRSTERMVRAIRALAFQGKPSQTNRDTLLGGLDVIDAEFRLLTEAHVHKVEVDHDDPHLAAAGNA